MNKVASIDIGSNTILLLVAEKKDTGFREIFSNSQIAGLGRGIDVIGNLSVEAQKDARLILNEFCKILERENIRPEEVICTATEAARVAKNACDFFNSIKAELGFEVQIINSECEAYFTALGVASDSSTPVEFSILDVGGASTEIMRVKKNGDDIEMIRSISLPVGSVRGSEWIKEKKFDLKIKKILNAHLDDYVTDQIICVAGSMTSVAGIFHNLKIFEEKIIHKTKISTAHFAELIGKIEFLNEMELLQKFPFLGKRACTILAGAKVGIEIGKKIGIKSFGISTLGLRHGSLRYMLKRHTGRIDEHFIYRFC